MLQVKGLSTEHGRLAAAQSQSHDAQLDINRRHQRNNSSGTSPSANVPLNSLKQECDSLMNPSSSGLSGFTPYMPHMYNRPLTFDAPRKRHLRSSFDQETRQSVLRDGSKGSAENASPVNRRRPTSSASSTAPTEADTPQTERASPQSRLVFIFHSIFDIHAHTQTHPKMRETRPTS